MTIDKASILSEEIAKLAEESEEDFRKQVRIKLKTIACLQAERANWLKAFDVRLDAAKAELKELTYTAPEPIAL